MRQARRRQARGAPKHQVKQFPAPIKGWYANDSVAAAPLKSAITLDNHYCNTDDVRIRRGDAEHSDTTTGSEVETLMQFHSGTASEMFAVSNGNIYDVTAGNPGGAAVTGLTNDRWQYTNMVTSAGQFLFCCNGVDTPRNYNGSAWSTSPAITGISDPTKIINVWQHKSRLFFIEDGTTTAYYLPVDSIGGAASALECGGYLKYGGKLMAGETWSIDAGDGPDDRLIVVSSQGEVLVFAGTDPSSASTWSFVGRFDLARPIGLRCMFRIGGDVLIITEEGVLPVSQIVQIDQAVTKRVSLTGNIQPAYLEAVRERKTNFGWQMISYPAESMAILNVPGGGNEDTHQYVMNVLSGAWSRFKGWDAICWIEFEGNIYYGAADGKVYQAETGSSDHGTAIEAFMLPAFSHLGLPGIQKHVQQIRPYVSSNSEIAPQLAVATDFEEPQQTFETVGIDTDFFTWDTSVWDGPDVWQGSQIFTGWRTGGGLGVYISPALYVAVDGGGSGGDLDYRILAFDVVFQPGHVNG